MNWEAVGAIGEIIGALAVFFTLIYLALQIRQNTKAQTIAMYEAAMSGFIEINSPVSTDINTASLWRKAIEDPASLSEDEAVQFEFLVRNYANHLLKVFRLYEQGVVPESDWDSFAVEAKQFFLSPKPLEFRENSQNFSELWADIDARDARNVSFLNRASLLTNRDGRDA